MSTPVDANRRERTRRRQRAERRNGDNTFDFAERARRRAAGKRQRAARRIARSSR